MLQDLGSDHLLLLLSVPLSPDFRPNQHPPSFNFQKARWDGFASYFDSHCPSAEKYSSLSLSSAAALFTSLALNAAKLAASNTLLKPGGLLRWKVRLVKNARLSLPLTEVMKTARLTSLLLRLVTTKACSTSLQNRFSNHIGKETTSSKENQIEGFLNLNAFCIVLLKNI